MVGLGAQPFGERLDRGDHGLTLQAGQDPGQDHRVAGQRERQRPGLMGGGLVGLGVRGWVQHPDHPLHERAPPPTARAYPTTGQLLDDRGHLLDLQAIGVPGDGVHMLAGDDPGAHTAARDGWTCRERPRAGQPAGPPRRPPPRASSTAPDPTNGRLPATVAACIRRANSYSTPATARASTSTSAAGRSPARQPHRRQVPDRHLDGLLPQVPHLPGRRRHRTHRARSTTARLLNPAAPPTSPISNTCTNPITGSDIACAPGPTLWTATIGGSRMHRGRTALTSPGVTPGHPEVGAAQLPRHGAGHRRGPVTGPRTSATGRAEGRASRSGPRAARTRPRGTSRGRLRRSRTAHRAPPVSSLSRTGRRTHRIARAAGPDRAHNGSSRRPMRPQRVEDSVVPPEVRVVVGGHRIAGQGPDLPVGARCLEARVQRQERTVDVRRQPDRRPKQPTRLPAERSFSARPASVSVHPPTPANSTRRTHPSAWKSSRCSVTSSRSSANRRATSTGSRHAGQAQRVQHQDARR